MTVYTVHAPVDAASETGVSDRTDKFVFIRDGFHVWALVFGPFWLLWNRLWLAFGLYVVVAVALMVTLSMLRVGSDAQFFVWLLLAFLVGLEGASLKRWSYSRRKWRQVDFVVADKIDAAEQNFFAHWSAKDHKAAPYRDASRPITPAHIYGVPPSDVMGSFPQPGASR